MSDQNHNRVTIFFNAQHRPYLYEAIHIVRGSQDNQWWERPFVISKRTADGKEVVYGTVITTYSPSPAGPAAAFGPARHIAATVL